METLKKMLRIGKLYLWLGKKAEAKDNQWKAFKNYSKAKQMGERLDDSAVIFMGEYYAQKRDGSPEAIENYLKYIKLQRQYYRNNKIISILKVCCRVQENDSRKIRKTAMQLNQRVIKINPGFDWAYYYLGLAHYLENQYSTAKTHLLKATKLNPKEPMPYYWLGKCHLLEKNTNAQEIMHAFTQFFALSVDGNELRAKRGAAAFQIGKLLFNEIDTYYKKYKCLTDTLKNRLTEAIDYFKKTVAIDKPDSQYYYYLGMAYSLKKEYSKAIDALVKATKIISNNKLYFLELARQHVFIDSLTEAQNALKKALALDSKFSEAIYLWADVKLSLREYLQSEHLCNTFVNQEGNRKKGLGRISPILISTLYFQDKFQHVINIFENLPEFLKQELTAYKKNNILPYIANSYFRLQNFDKAVNVFQAAFDKKKKQPDIIFRYSFACALANKGNLEQALTEFNNVLAGEDDYRDKAYLQRGHIFLKQKKIQNALDSYQKAYEIQQKNPTTLYAIGNIHYILEENEQALFWFYRVLEIDPVHGQTHFGIGLIKEKQQKFAESITEYEAAIKSAYGHTLARIRLGILYCKEKRYQDAMDYFNTIRESAKGHRQFRFYMGVALFYCNKFDQALELWQQLYSDYPDDAKLVLNICRAHYQLGCQYIEEKRYAEAIGEWEKYLEKYAADERTTKNLGKVYFRYGINTLLNKEGDYLDKARDLFKQAIELDQDNQSYLYYYGLCHLATGNANECLTQLSRLLDARPDDPRLQYHMALTLLNKGEKENAMNIFHELAQKDENNSYVSHAAWIIANEHIKENNYDKAISHLEAVT